MQISNRFVVLIGAATCAISGITHAAVLADYRFTSNPTNTEPLVTDSTASAVTLSGGIVYSSVIGNPAGGASVAVNLTDGTDQSSAIAANDYIAFTLTPNVGYALDLADLRFDWVIQRDSKVANPDPNPWTATAFLKSSVGGFSSGDPTLGTASRSTSYFGIGNGATENAWQNVVFDLSSIANSTSPVTFRLYLYDNGSYADSRIRLDNVVVNGAVVPEPASLAGLGLMGLLLQRRRRQ